MNKTVIEKANIENRIKRDFAIKELEKIKAEIQAEQITDGQVYNGEYFSDDALNINYGISIGLDILDKYISELKGENNAES